MPNRFARPDAPVVRSRSSERRHVPAQAEKALIAACTDPATPKDVLMTAIRAISTSSVRSRTFPTPVDRQGRSALMLAAAAHSPAVVRALLPLSNPAAQDQEGRTALMHAASGCVPANLDVLVPVSDPTTRNSTGWTALMFAAASAQPAMLPRLLTLAPAVDLLAAMEVALVHLRMTAVQQILDAMPTETLTEAVDMIDKSLDHAFARTVRTEMLVVSRLTHTRIEQAILHAAINGMPPSAGPVHPRARL